MKMNQNGFTLIEALLAGGLLCALGYFLMIQQQTASKVQSRMNYNQELNGLVAQLQTTLAKKSNCTLTVKGKKVGDSLTSIKLGHDDPSDPNRPPIFDSNMLQINSVIGKDLHVKSMQIVKKTDQGGNYIGDAIRVHFQAAQVNNNVVKATSEVGGGSLNRDFMLNGEKDGSGRYITCYSELGNLVETACLSMGASWDSTTSKCKLTNMPTCVLAIGSTCGSMYKKVDEFALSVASLNRTCTQEYERKGWPCAGTKHFSRTCSCYGLNCTCDTGDVGCYSKEGRVCQGVEQAIQTTKCCQI